MARFDLSEAEWAIIETIASWRGRTAVRTTPARRSARAELRSSSCCGLARHGAISPGTVWPTDDGIQPVQSLGKAGNLADDLRGTLQPIAQLHLP